MNAEGILFIIPLLIISGGIGIITFWKNRYKQKNKWFSIIYLSLGILLILLGIVFAVPFIVFVLFPHKMMLFS